MMGMALAAARLLVLFALVTALAMLLGRFADGVGAITYTRELIRSGQYVDLPDIYLHDLDRDRVLNLTRTPDQIELEPVWSSDGLRLAYVAYALRGGLRRICLIDLTGPDRCFDPAGGWYDHPVWIADQGRERLFFEAHDTEFGSAALVEGLPDGQLRPLDPRRDEGSAFYAARAVVQRTYSAAVSPDGGHAIIPMDVSGDAHLFLVDLGDASAPARQISSGRGDFFYPSWRPR
jgi:Tol biopolymer transport system component